MPLTTHRPGGRRRERARRHRPVLHPSLRQPRTAPAQHARPLHDVLGADDAGAEPGDRARAVHDAIAACGRRSSSRRWRSCCALSLRAQRVGRRVLRRRAAADDARLPADRGAAGRRRAVLRRRADAGSCSASTRSSTCTISADPRSVCDDARRRADHPRPSDDRRRPEHDRARLPAVPRAGRRAAERRRTCTTCRCRSPPNAACRRSALWLWFVVAVVVGAVALFRQRAARRPAALPVGHRAGQRRRDARRRACSSTTSATPSSRCCSWC